MMGEDGLQEKILVHISIWRRNRNWRKTANTHHCILVAYHLMENLQGKVSHHKWPLKALSILIVFHSLTLKLPNWAHLAGEGNYPAITIWMIFISPLKFSPATPIRYIFYLLLICKRFLQPSVLHCYTSTIFFRIFLYLSHCIEFSLQSFSYLKNKIRFIFNTLCTITSKNTILFLLNSSYICVKKKFPSQQFCCGFMFSVSVQSQKLLW